jgi:hypothetical protein
MSEIDIIRFSEARAKALSEESEPFSVGRLSEKLVHRTLKYYIDSDASHHEIKYLGSVADVKNSDGIFEIQSRSFDQIEKKLTKYLGDGKVTLVYPLISERYLTWINPENGEAELPHRVSKKGRASDVLPELARISAHLLHENLTIRIYSLSADEYRTLDGYGAEKKKRATKINLIPRELMSISEYSNLRDFASLLPEGLESRFFAKDFYVLTRLRGRRGWLALKLCTEIGLVRCVGKSGNAFIYEKCF